MKKKVEWKPDPKLVMIITKGKDYRPTSADLKRMGF